MDINILTATIQASGTVLAAFVGSLGAGVIFINRNCVIRLSKNVEAYHFHEGKLIEELLRRDGKEVTPDLIKKWRGTYRTQLAPPGSSFKPEMTVDQARSIRRRYLSFD